MTSVNVADRTRVLVVDDDPSVRALLEMALEDTGWLVETVGDAEAGLERVKQQGFDLFMVDRDLPGMTGADFIRKARGLAGESEMVLITGSRGMQAAAEALALGVSAFLLKPFDDVFEVVETVRKLDERRRRRVERQRGASSEASSLDDVTRRLREMRDNLERFGKARAVKAHALIAVFEPTAAAAVRDGLEQLGLAFSLAAGPDDVGTAAAGPVNLLLIGVAPGDDVLALAERSRKAAPEAPLVLVGPSLKPEVASRLVRYGVAGFISPPPNGRDSVRDRMREICERLKLEI